MKISHALAILLMMIWSAMATSCGQARAEHATADDVVRSFNNIAGQEYADVSALFAMFHAETPQQQQVLDALKSIQPIIELDAAMRAEFHTAWEELAVQSLYWQFRKPATIVEQDEHHATAEYIDFQEVTRKLHLVKANDGWWISARTLEDHEAIAREFAEGKLTLSINNREAFARVAPEMVRRIRAAEFPYQLAARRITHEVAGVHFDRPIPGEPRP